MPYPMAATIRSGRPAAAAASNWWEVSGKTCVGAYQAKGVASLAASYTNLANPGTNDLTLVASGPMWSSANGWECNGFNDILDTGLVPSSDWTLIARFSNASGSNNDVAGVLNSFTNQRFYLRASDSVARHLYGYGNASTVVSGNKSSGVMAVTQDYGYLDGAQDAEITTTWVATSLSIYVNGSNGFPYNFNGNVQAVAIYSDTLTSGEVGTLTTAMNAL